MCPIEDSTFYGFVLAMFFLEVNYKKKKMLMQLVSTDLSRRRFGCAVII